MTKPPFFTTSGKFTAGHRRSAKLTPEQVLELRTLYSEHNWSQGRLARHYGISVGQVGRIVRGEQWQEYTQIPTDQEVEDRAFFHPVVMPPDAIDKILEKFDKEGLKVEKIENADKPPEDPKP